MKKLIIFIIVFVITFSLAACGNGATTQQNPSDSTTAPSVNTGILIEYDTNILMNIYDIRISMNDSVLGTQKQGEKKLYELSLPEGVHEITFSEVGDDKNITTKSVTVTEDEYYYFFIKTRNSGIEIEKQDTMMLDEVKVFLGIEGNANTQTSETLSSTDDSVPTQSKENVQPAPTSDTVNELTEEIDLNAINATNSVDSDKEFVGKTYRVKGVIGEVIPPSDGLDALVIIHPDIMAKGMDNTQDLEINIWVADNMFDIIGNESSVGREVEITAVLSGISRNATSNDTEVKGYPIQLEFNATNAVILSDENTDNTTSDDDLEKHPSNISIWDGDHTELKKLIKENMSDENSYKHIETKWIYIDDSTTQQEINELFAGIGWSDKISIGDFVIITEFSGRNAFNAIIKNTAYGIEYENGDVKLLGFQ